MTSTTTDRRFGVSGNLPFKAPVRCATTANITLSGLQTIDGVALAADDRVLVKNQTTASENGIYTASSGSWSRAIDFNGNRDVVKGTAVYVTDGSTNAGAFYSVTTANPVTIGTSSITFAISVAAGDLATQLANTSNAALGSGLSGFSWSLNYAANTIGWAAMTARYSILKYIPVAQWAGIFAYTSTYDATADLASALAAEALITLPPGLIRGEWDMSNVRGRTIIGVSRDVSSKGSVLENVDNTALFTLNNTTSDCKNNHFERFHIRNRDTATYTTFDGFLISGNASNENGFHTWTEVDIVGARYSWNVTSRLIWSKWSSCHGSAGLNDIWHFDTSQNCAELTWEDCRGAGAGRGMSINKTSGDPFFSWKLIGVNLEKNALQGLYITGVGVSGLSIVGGHYEENTTTMAAGNDKTNIYCDATQLVGFNVMGAALLGTPLATPLNHAIRITSTTVAGQVHSCRPGTFSGTFAHCDNGALVVGPLDGGTASISGSGAYTLGREAFTNFTGSLTGCTTVPTGTVQYSVQLHQVTLDIPVIEGTSNTTAATITGMPAAIRPAATKTVFALVKDNGTTVTGLAQIDSAGVITLQNGIGGGAFTNSGTKGVRAQQVTYLLD